MKVETYFQLFVAVLALRVSEGSCEDSRKRLRQIFNQRLDSAAQAMRAAIAARGVRRADDIADVYQQACLRLIRYFDRLLAEAPMKLAAIAANLNAYVAEAAGRTALTWLRGEARRQRQSQPLVSTDGEPGVREDHLADRSTPSVQDALEATETAQALNAIHLEVLRALQSGAGADIIGELSNLHRTRTNSQDSYEAFLWIYGYLFGSGMDESKRRDLSADLIGRMTGLAPKDPAVRASREWLAARNRLDVQIHRLRKRAKEMLSGFRPAVVSAAGSLKTGPRISGGTLSRLAHAA